MVRQDGQVRGDDRRLERPARRERRPQGRQRLMEDLVKIVGILPRHQVAVRGQSHGLAEGHRRLSGHILFHDSSQATGARQPDRVVDLAGILDRGGGQDSGDPFGSVR